MAHRTEGNPRVQDRPPECDAACVRVAMFTAESQRGHARYARELLTAMANAGRDGGFSLELVTSRDLSPEFQTDRYPTHAILPPLRDRSDFRTRLQWAASRVAHYLQRERTFLRWVESQPDLRIVHFQEYTPWLAPAHFPWLKRRGVKVVATVHNIANYQHASQRYMQFSRHCWRRAWRSCSALAVHTEGLKRALADFLGPGHPPIFVTPHGVWEERSRPAFVPTLPPAGEPAHLLFFGVIRRMKGLNVMLRAMEHLPNCVLTIAGEPDPGEHYEESLRRIAALPAGRVRLAAGYIAETEIERFFDESHLVVLPYTDFASQSGVLHQALAHGRPVVASAVGGLGESVTEWAIGEVVTPGDPLALADGVRRALEPERYRAAAAAVTEARNARTWTRQAEATFGIYRAILS